MHFENNHDCAAASEAVVAAFEQAHAFSVPPEYRAFLLNSGGGLPSLRWSSFDRTGDFVAHVYGLRNGAEWKQLGYAIKHFGHDLSQFLPVAVSNGGNYFLLRLIEPDCGAVYFWDHEMEGSEPPTFEFLIRISDSFNAWLENLREDP